MSLGIAREHPLAKKPAAVVAEVVDVDAPATAVPAHVHNTTFHKEDVRVAINQKISCLTIPLLCHLCPDGERIDLVVLTEPLDGVDVFCVPDELGAP